MQDMATFHPQFNAVSIPSPGSVARSLEMRSKLPASVKNEDLQLRIGKEGFEHKNDLEYGLTKNESLENGRAKSDNELQCVCPICKTALSNQHDFTLHIRSHNNDSEPSNVNSSKGFTCRICGKVLGSASSLDRHVLVHSGERPFRCHICGLLFKTNGNMHRHIRTAHNLHGRVNESNCNESDSSTDSNSENQKSPFFNKKRRVNSSTGEFNNNSIDMPSKCERTRDPSSNAIEFRQRINCDGQWFSCPVCSREDFSTLHVLENHIEDAHPDYKIKCNPCNLEFSNHKKLNLHRTMKHPDEELKSSEKGLVGFKDLTFVDFSSEKFPYIAKTVCEKQLHRSASLFLNFQCEKCHRAFPCADALTIHEQACLSLSYSSSVESYIEQGDVSSSENEGPTDLSSKSFRKWNYSMSSTEEDKKRDSFFAGLDLQNRSSSLSPSNSPQKLHLFKRALSMNGTLENKDLADIQSIINVTSANFITDLSKSPQPSSLEVTPPDSGSRNFDLNAEEEQQDCFAAEFRKMKLEGKFPCRLCKSVFTNLRALKGHNRIHLTNSPSNGIYRCNMCPHQNTDKAALIRHMRTHNGERPYQCSICRYAFTTKANCERHLKNRHAKASREEVKKSIIYHPSEDSTNSIPDMKNVKRLLFAEYQDTLNPGKETEAMIDRTLLPDIKKESPERSTITPPLSHHSDELKRPGSDNDRDDIEIKKPHLDESSLSSDDEDSERNELDQTFKSVESESLQHESLNHHPLDLSMDVLDLSKKKRDDSDVSLSAEKCNKSRNSDFSASEDEDFETEDNLDDEEQHAPQDLSKKSTYAKLDRVSSSPNFTNNAELSDEVKSLKEEQRASPSESAYRKTDPKNLLSNLYANNLNLNSHPPYLGSGPTFPFAAAPFPPYLLPPPPFMFSPTTPELAAAKEQWQKEIMRGFQLTSGGSLMLDQLSVVSAADRFQALQQHALAEFNRQMESAKNESLTKSFSPTAKSPDLGQPPATQEMTNFMTQEKQSPDNITQLPKSLKNDPSSSIKMVIKNGMLIPKQKQRRYRTERPFACEHCSARFTLRSNMERHIKQQHPQYWSQRQRGSNGSRGRGGYLKAPLYEPHAGLIIPFPASYAQSNSRHSLTSNEESDSFQRNSSERSLELNFQSKPYIGISDEVKFAISQQLKSKFQHEERDDESDAGEEESRDDEDMEELVIDEEEEEKSLEVPEIKEEEEEEKKSTSTPKKEENADLASVSRILDNASTQTFKQFFKAEDENAAGEASEEEEEGFMPGSTSEGNISGSDENKSEPENSSTGQVKKKSAYSLAPNRVSCPYCSRKFPWTSSLRRHVLTHTGQKPYKCPQCPLLFTTKSNCDRHLQRKHSSPVQAAEVNPVDCNKPNSALNFTTRNVPERPYKCKNCPSSTFSTLDNLKKHMSEKHNGKPVESERLDSGNHSDCENEQRDGNFSEYESQGSSEEIDVVKDSPRPEERHNSEVESRSNNPPLLLQPTVDSSTPTIDQVSVVPGSTDLPFKCHLCDSSYAERHEALDHIRDRHSTEFQLLISKGALDANGFVNEENSHIEENSTHGEENIEQLRGKFPDYANRKVKCAFCLRRFWSAEDLRRHMRTHTGERPFSCDICDRRFTLKHSMLRHRKKHSSGNNFVQNPLTDDHSAHSDDDNGLLASKLPVPVINHNNNNINSPFKAVFTNSLKFWKSHNAQGPKGLRGDCDEGNDLIGNLLGIHDKSIIDKMLLSKSPDDVAKLLGVQK
nr:PREDICTED: ras-responsive element-binding protein 1-like [Bemisia tabaci]XP_018899139.1 PREDICTED: ras-responsive element-binding protein 1-like [Bemisia tabaci]